TEDLILLQGIKLEKKISEKIVFLPANSLHQMITEPG
ncbi:hypothetical protein JDF658_26910, partial [Carboxydocella sp. JDF658]